MLTYTKDMFIASDDQCKSRYAEGFMCCPSGIDGLAIHGVSPYHVAVPLSKRTGAKVVVYAIYDNSILTEDPSPSHCFFEDDYKEGFHAYSSMNYATLWVGYLRKTSTNAMQVWLDNSDYIDEHHANSLQWTGQSWAI